ncbi:trigger factor [Candidatus Saccharibacteria bacterium]|nr:MAG: trigger factor [Candidatus Saccharibacteria bacterium]
MKHTFTKTSETEVELKVTLDATDLKATRELTLTKLAKQVKVPGFRQGKVPAKIAEKNLDPSAIEAQLLQDAVNKFVIQAIDTEGVQPLDRPQVDIDSFEPGKELVFTAKVEVLPTVTLGDYKNLKAERENVDVSDDEINEVIDRMRQGYAEKKEVEREAKTGDEVWIDFSGTDEKGQPVPGATGKDYPLNLGSNTFIPGFEEGLVGKKPGEEFDLPLTFPKDYHHDALKGAKVTFKVTVKGVKEVSLPEVDDEFAKKAGPFESADDLKKDIAHELKAQKERVNDDKLKDALVEQLVNVSTVPVPQVLVKDQIESIERDTVQNLLYRGLTLEQYLKEQDKTVQQWRDSELKDAAERRVQVGLALAELSKVENIEVSKEEFEQRLDEMKRQYNDPKMQAQLDSPDARRNLVNRVLTEKTVDRLVELNKAKEAPAKGVSKPAKKPAQKKEKTS